MQRFNTLSFRLSLVFALTALFSAAPRALAQAGSVPPPQNPSTGGTLSSVPSSILGTLISLIFLP